MTAAELLREKAREHELNAASLEERGDVTSASHFSAIAIVLYEVAEAIEESHLEEAA